MIQWSIKELINFSAENIDVTVRINARQTLAKVRALSKRHEKSVFSVFLFLKNTMHMNNLYVCN